MGREIQLTKRPTNGREQNKGAPSHLETRGKHQRRHTPQWEPQELLEEVEFRHGTVLD